MSVALDQRLQSEQVGTKFRLWPQPAFLNIFDEPEVVTISLSPESIKPGPSDDRMYVVDAVSKAPYNKFFRPPYAGQSLPAVKPGEDGHFLHLQPGSRDFSCAAMYATVRRVLDIWQDYFGHRIAWHFETEFERLELIPLVEWNNAQSGYGFLEFGYGRSAEGGVDHRRPYCENFDVLAHELGHSIISAEVGVPASKESTTLDYGGMHESAGDLVAIVSALHFDKLIDKLLERTSGNLLTINGLSRVGELDQSREIRIALNGKRMSDVGAEPHERSLPLTGAIFDCMVMVFQDLLVEAELISAELAKKSSNLPGSQANLAAVNSEFVKAFAGNEKYFKEHLLKARDYLGRLLAVTWSSLEAEHLTYHDILRGLMRADRQVSQELRQADKQRIIRECFAWREIAPVPDSVLLRPHTLKECGLLD